MSISNVAPVANNTGTAALSDAGIGSGLDVNSIVSKLMQVEAQPLTQLNNQISSYQATLSAYGTVNSSLSTFQNAIQALNAPNAFNTESVTASNSAILSGTATTSATNGSYNVNVTQLAQAQSLTATGQASTSAAIGSGTATTVSFSVRYCQRRPGWIGAQRRHSRQRHCGRFADAGRHTYQHQCGDK